MASSYHELFIADGMRCVRQIALLKHWNRLRGDRQLPAFDDLMPEDMARFRESLVIVGVVAGAAERERFRVLYSGDQFERMNARSLVGLPLQEAVHAELAAQALKEQLEVVASRAPRFSLSSIRPMNSSAVRYERLLLPYRVRGNGVDIIVGTVTFISEDNKFNPRDIARYPILPA